MTLKQFEPKKMYIRKEYPLPSDYQEVEYIYSKDIACCINTGLVPPDNFELNFKFFNAENYSSQRYIFGTGAASDNPRLNLRLNTTAGSYSFFINSDTGAAQSVGTWALGLNTIHDLTIKGDKINNTLNFKVGTTDTIGTYNPNQSFISPIRFFNYSGDTATSAANMRVYLFTIKGDSGYLRYMIPCYRKNDGEVGMFDVINQVFYTNVNTGELGIPSEYYEICTLCNSSLTDGVAELNTKADYYYNLFSSQGHIYNVCLSDDGSSYRFFTSGGVNYVVYYSNGTWAYGE